LSGVDRVSGTTAAAASLDTAATKATNNVDGNNDSTDNSNDETHDRALVEFLSSDKSKLGTRAPGSCKVVRLTLDLDMTKQEGVDAAKATIIEEDGVFLWGSLPCTAGSPRQTVNVLKPGGKARIRAHRRVVKRLIANFRECALLNKSLGGLCGFEWPKDCTLWSEREVAQLRMELALEDVVFDGCAFGLVSHHGSDAGLPIKKPWRVATDMAVLRDMLQHYRCPGKQ
jgi:hypothetical protein